MNIDNPAAVILSIAVLALVVVPIISWFVLHYRLWSMVQCVGAKTTPVKATALLLIPLFNYYWTFVSLLGLTRHFNKLIKKYTPSADPVSIHIPLWACIGFAVGGVANLFTGFENMTVQISAISVMLVIVMHDQLVSFHPETLQFGLQ